MFDGRFGGSRFTEHLVRLNSLRFGRWLVDPGMEFLSAVKWWGDRGRRRRPHNGLDLRAYETDEGERANLAAGTKVPVLWEGRVVRTCEDFLGRTIVVAHDVAAGSTRLFSFYGHVLPASQSVPGAALSEGTAIATLAAVGGASVPAHLHLAAALIPRSIPPEAFTWEFLDAAAGIRFLDPLPRLS